MKNLNIKHLIISSLTVYILGILAFVGSYFVPFMEDADFQANMVLMIVVIPAAFLGAHLYYRRGNATNGFLLGSTMFLSAMILDAIITVPVFIIPNGGSHLTFFGDPGFWLIALEYIIVVALYWRMKVVNQARA